MANRNIKKVEQILYGLSWYHFKSLTINLGFPRARYFSTIRTWTASLGISFC